MKIRWLKEETNEQQLADSGRKADRVTELAWQAWAHTVTIQTCAELRKLTALFPPVGCLKGA